MKGLTIKDRVADATHLAFDIGTILRLIEDLLGDTRWRVSGVECVGRKARLLHRESDTGGMVETRRLLELADGIEQTVDGLFEGFSGSEPGPWIRIRAVDSSEFDVETTHLGVIERLRQRFKNVEDLPQ